MFATILISYGLGPSEIGFLQSTTLLTSTLLTPVIASRIDDGKAASTFLTLVIFLVLGYVPLILPYQGHKSYYLLTVFLMTGMAILNVCVVRVTEGGVENSLIQSFAAKTYMASNLGMGVAATIAYFYLEAYKTELVLLDLGTTVGLVVFLAFVYKKIGLQGSVLTKSHGRTQPTFFEGLRHAKEVWRLSLGTILIFFTAYAQVSALPFLYKLNSPSKLEEFVAVMLFVNNAAVVATSWYLSGRPKPMGSKAALFLIPALIGTPYLFIPFFVDVWSVVLTTAVWSVGEAIAYAYLSSVYLSESPQKSFVLAVKDSSIRMSIVIVPLVSSALFSFNVSNFIVAGVFFVAPVIGSILVWNHIRR